jgi:hypothetical protein
MRVPVETCRMNGNFLLLASLSVTLFACASGSRRVSLPPAEAARCASVQDTLSKYISTDALPFAHMIGTPRVLPAPPALRRGDSIAVDFVVRPDGLADPSSVDIAGSNDPGFVRSVLRFVTESRFIPARVSGCDVLSRYNLVIKPAA